MHPDGPTRRWDLGPAVVYDGMCRVARCCRGASLCLDGRGQFVDGWITGPLVAVSAASDPDVDRAVASGDGVRTLEAIERLVRGRRDRGGTAATGVAVLLAYEMLNDGAGLNRRAPAPGAAVVLNVDASVSFGSDGAAVLTAPRETGAALFDEVVRWVNSAADEPPPPARVVERPSTSLPREAYLDAVSAIRRHIRRGDVYQANLCQRFHAAYAGDELELYLTARRRTPAPRSAYLRVPGLSLASLSPESFVRVRPPDRIETRPIKGTRPRGATPEADADAVRTLLGSEKDRAELLMIVDLERNDLGRVCRAGSIRVAELAELRSYATVHHLVARVEGRLRPGTRESELLRAVFPGGSITGAPKRRAMQILERLEPVCRGFFTGCLIWFGDDGTTDSSILIRSLVLSGGRVDLGAGGGVVYDSDPEDEWRESNHKAAALADCLGFHPEEAS